MSLPLSINLTIARHILGARLRGRTRVPLVLMLEITHECNLACAGCGRIREYAASKDERITPAQARQAIAEADTPVVSVSGGEPLLHPDAPAIVADALAGGRIVYLCTNALLLARRLPEFTPHRRLFLNVHVDGPAEIHDRLTGVAGSTQRALGAIAAARTAGFQVTTNTTVYADTPAAAVAALFGRLTEMGVRGMMLAPAFAYDVGIGAPTLRPAEVHAWMRTFRAAWGERNLTHTPAYMEFLRGERALSCVPWGTVTYSVHGWKRPCYLLTDGYAESCAGLLADTPWDGYGPGRDARCAGCMLHSGFEPAVMSSLRTPADLWRMARWQLGGEGWRRRGRRPI